MDSIDAVARSLDGYRLRRARRFRRMTRAELADHIGVSAMAVGKYENGMRIRPHLLVAVASALQFPVDFFAWRGPAVRLEPGDLHLRKPGRLTAADRYWAAAFAEHLAEQVDRFELVQGLPVVTLPRLRGTPEQAAAHLRAVWLLGDGPVTGLVELLESRGLMVATSPDDEAATRVGSFSTSAAGRPMMVLPAAKAKDPWTLRHMAAHELGRLVLHPLQFGDTGGEVEAEAFAAAFLLPETALDEISTRRVQEASQRWGVPVRTVARRLRDTGRVSISAYYRLLERPHLTPSRQGWEHLETSRSWSWFSSAPGEVRGN